MKDLYFRFHWLFGTPPISGKSILKEVRRTALQAIHQYRCVLIFIFFSHSWDLDGKERFYDASQLQSVCRSERQTTLTAVGATTSRDYSVGSMFVTSSRRTKKREWKFYYFFVQRFFCLLITFYVPPDTESWNQQQYCGLDTTRKLFLLLITSKL